jgi:hypothetical protein
MSTLSLGLRFRYMPEMEILEGRLAPATMGPAPAETPNSATPAFVGPLANPSQSNSAVAPPATQTGTPAQTGQQTNSTTTNQGLTAFPNIPANAQLTPSPAPNAQVLINIPPSATLVPLPNQLFNIANVSLTDTTSANVARLAASGASVPTRASSQSSYTREQEWVDFQDLRVPMDYISAVLELSTPDQIVPASALMHLNDATQEPIQQPDNEPLNTDGDMTSATMQEFT